MSVSEALPIPQPSGPRPPASRLARWFALAVIALALSAAMGFKTGTASYEEQLADVAAAQGLSRDAYDAARASPALRQVFLAAAGDRELTLKLELALLKYPDRARNVLEMFGRDAHFQDVLLRHGETVIPVIDHFMVTDMKLLWAQAKLQEAWEAILERFRRRQAPAADVEASVYGPRVRGIYAIEALLVEGHHFLGQFVLDKEGRVQRIQTDRVLETLKRLFTGGITDLEAKYRTGDAIELPDVAWAGADVLSVFGLTKAVKYLGKASVAGKAAEEAAVVRRTLMGRSVLAGEAVGKRVALMGAKVAAVYLVVRHPSLLSGVFGALGQLLGLPPWLSVLLGWWGIALVALCITLPLLRALTLLIAPLRWVAGAAAWISPPRSGAARRSTSA